MQLYQVRNLLLVNIITTITKSWFTRMCAQDFNFRWSGQRWINAGVCVQGFYIRHIGQRYWNVHTRILHQIKRAEMDWTVCSRILDQMSGQRQICTWVSGQGFCITWHGKGGVERSSKICAGCNCNCVEQRSWVDIENVSPDGHKECEATDDELNFFLPMSFFLTFKVFLVKCSAWIFDDPCNKSK